MKPWSSAFKVAPVLGLAALFLGTTASTASAGLFGPRTVIVTPPAYPAYAVPAPVTTVYTAPVSSVVTSPVPTILSAPMVDPGLVPASYSTSTVITSPVPTTYVAPAPVVAPGRVRVVYPRRVYRYYGY